MAETAMFSVDLEPNKDDTLNGVREAMEWFNRTVPTGTVFATYRIATELPALLAGLSKSHEIGVHVHPREFGYDHDWLAELSVDCQRSVIDQTRTAITEAVGTEPVSFRAGRHSASRETFTVLKDIGFAVDASINVRYDEYLSEELTKRSEPFKMEELIEVPVTYGTLPVLSRCGFRSVFERPVTATAATLRADRWGCSGETAVKQIAANAPICSFYMHPYDTTEYHSIENSGREFRRRFESLIDWLRQRDTSFASICDVDLR